MATKIHARNASIYVDDSSGACTSISGDLNSVSLSMDAEAPEVTAFGNNTVQRLTQGLISWEASIEGFWGQGATAAACVMFGLLAGSTYLQLGPAGSTSTCPKFTGCCLLSSFEVSFGVNDAATFSANLQSRSGSLTASAF